MSAKCNYWSKWPEGQTRLSLMFALLLLRCCLAIGPVEKQRLPTSPLNWSISYLSCSARQIRLCHLRCLILVGRLNGLEWMISLLIFNPCPRFRVWWWHNEEGGPGGHIISSVCTERHPATFTAGVGWFEINDIRAKQTLSIVSVLTQHGCCREIQHRSVSPVVFWLIMRIVLRCACGRFMYVRTRVNVTAIKWNGFNCLTHRPWLHWWHRF